MTTPHQYSSSSTSAADLLLITLLYDSSSSSTYFTCSPPYFLLPPATYPLQQLLVPVHRPYSFTRPPTSSSWPSTTAGTTQKTVKHRRQKKKSPWVKTSYVNQYFQHVHPNLHEHETAGKPYNACTKFSQFKSERHSVKNAMFFHTLVCLFFSFERVTHTSCSVLCFTRLLYYTILLAYTILLLAWFETPLNRFYCIIYIPYTVYIPYRREETKHCELLSTGYFKAEGKIAFSSQTFQHQNSI